MNFLFSETIETNEVNINNKPGVYNINHFVISNRQSLEIYFPNDYVLLNHP